MNCANCGRKGVILEGHTPPWCGWCEDAFEEGEKQSARPDRKRIIDILRLFQRTYNKYYDYFNAVAAKKGDTE
jgi:hypothetical protein